MKKAITFILAVATIALLASCGTENAKPKPDNVNSTWKLNQPHTKGKWIGSGGVADIAYAKSQTGDTWKVVRIDNPVKYGLEMRKYHGYLMIAFNDSTYQKQGEGKLKFQVQPSTIFGISTPNPSQVFYSNFGAYLKTYMEFNFKCNELSNYHSQKEWRVYHVTPDYEDTLKVFVFTDISGALQTAKDVMSCN